VELDDLADRMDAVGNLLADAGPALDRLDPGPFVLGGDAPGAPGELGRALHSSLTAGLAARGREAVAHAARLSDTAHGLRLVAERYAEVERVAGERHADGVT
jgi:hypothetical protein